MTIRYVPPITYQPKASITYRPPTEIAYLPKAASKLSPGQSLKPGESLNSPNGRFRFTYEESGNLILRDLAPVPGASGAVEWQSTTWQPLGVAANWGAFAQSADDRFIMQADGNLVLYRAGVAIWSTMTPGHPGAFFVVQDDGNAVLYDGSSPLWAAWNRTITTTHDTWFGALVKTAGRALASATHAIGEGFTEIGGFLGDIPIVGPLLSGVLLIASGPFTFTESIIEGERLDRALIDDFRNKITALREIAPYAQTILSLVPGIGSGVAAAIGAGLALAQGMPIDEALIEGLKSILPGGPAARAALTITYGAAKGDNVLDAAGQAAIDALGLSPEASKGLHQAMGVVVQASQGENIAVAVLQQARSYLPTPELQQAFDFGLAMAQGKRLQDALMSEIGNLSSEQVGKIKDVGLDLIESVPALKAARDTIGQEAVKAFGSRGGSFDPKSGQYIDAAKSYGHTVQDGYNYGVGLLRHGGVNEQNLQVIRSQLTPNEQQGFDMGLAAYRAAVVTHAPADKPASEVGAYLVTRGLAGNPNPQTKTTALQFFTVNPVSSSGVRYAIAQIKRAENPSLWKWFLGLLGIGVVAVMVAKR